MATEKMLTVLPVHDYTVGPYNYYVSTPDEGYMYFYTKQQANNFIEFYKQHQNKRNKNGNNKSLSKYTTTINCE